MIKNLNNIIEYSAIDSIKGSLLCLELVIPIHNNEKLN